MFDIVTDIFRAAITGAIFFYLSSLRGKASPQLRKVWIFFIIGFGFLLFGGVLNVIGNFPGLSRYLVIGRLHPADFLEETVGYVLGFIFLGIGFWQWLPAIMVLHLEENRLKKSEEQLKYRVAELTEACDKLQAQLECQIAVGRAVDPINEKNSSPATGKQQ
jgi:hypothetical protein